MRRKNGLQISNLREVVKLKKLILVGLVALHLTGCTWTDASKIAPGEYMITSSGSIFNSRAGLLENINQEAKKACGGADYHLEGDKDANMLVSTVSHLGPTPTTMLGLKAVCEGRSE